MLKRFVLLAAIGAALLTFAGSAGAITGTTPRTSRTTPSGCSSSTHRTRPPREDPFSRRLSGTLITPTVMVTAGHCTAGVNDGRVIRQSVAPNYDPNAFGGWGGDPTTGYPYQNGVTFHRADTTAPPAPADEGRRRRRSRPTVTPANGSGVPRAGGDQSYT